MRKVLKKSNYFEPLYFCKNCAGEEDKIMDFKLLMNKPNRFVTQFLGLPIPEGTYDGSIFINEDHDEEFVGNDGKEEDDDEEEDLSQHKRKRAPKAISKCTVTSSNPLKKKRSENVDGQITTLLVCNVN